MGIMQNHLLQILVFLTMEKPKSLNSKDIIQAKTNLLKSIPELKKNKYIIGQFSSSDFKKYNQDEKDLDI